MGSTSATEEEANNDHVIRIWDFNEDRLASMHQKISNPPKLLSKAAGKRSCCVFRVPQSFVDVNGKCYQPHIVSIGPYHHGKPHLQMIEEHKWRYLGTLLNRVQTKGLVLEDFLKALGPLEMMARECYSETIHLETDAFIEMMVVDGCFILELFRKLDGKFSKFEADDPIVSMAWILPFFYRDFLKLENQIPYFVLERLFELSKIPNEEESGKSLSLLALNFFNNIIQRPDEVIAKYQDLTGKHLLDLVSSGFIPPDHKDQPIRFNTPSHVIHCVSKLRRAGINFKPQNSDSFLVVEFKHGVIEMPTITIDDFMNCFLQNCVAYEQCHRYCSKHFTTYATLLDYLINTSKDVEYLCDSNIVENYFGTDAEVARFINNLGKDIAFDINRCYLSKFFNDVHQYYQNSWHVHWASFKYTYFDTPWSFISALAAAILLLFTVAQTFYTVYQFYNSNGNDR